jgi:16S rRNA (cytidine1402-2'-O)-methyltransferase
MAGILYVVATPIGNLEDISHRAVEILGRVSLIACEDTRVTSKLLTRYRIQTRTVSYHEHNEKRRTPQLVGKLAAGLDIALTSDAGTPGISDPGYRVVNEARKHNIEVYAIPGPSAVLAALAISGLPTSSFCFHGFLPTRQAARRQAIDSLAESPHTLVLFESARRARTLLAALAERMGPRNAFVAREMTKLHEEHQFGTLLELAHWAQQKPLRGELTLVIDGNRSAPKRSHSEHFESDAGATANTADLRRRFQELIDDGLTRRQAAKQLSRDRGIPSRWIYQHMLKPEPSEPGESNENS